MTEENIYNLAAAKWVSQTYNLDARLISGVTFGYSGNGCETCGYGEGVTIEFKYGDDWLSEDLPAGVTPGSFLEACVALL